MAGDIITGTGARVYIGPTVTSTAADSLAEFQALTPWTEIGLVESVGSFGAKSNSVTFAALGDAYMRKQKGIRDAGDLTITVAHDPTDAGQDAVEAAEPLRRPMRSRSRFRTRPARSSICVAT
jgi:hypothetical protein